MADTPLDEIWRQEGSGYEDSGQQWWPSRSNTFARMGARDVLQQLTNARYRLFGSASDTSRGFRAMALQNLYTPKELAAPRGTTYADYATRAEMDARRKKVVSNQLDQLQALDAELQAQRRVVDGQTKEAARAKSVARIQSRITQRALAAPAVAAAGNELVSIYSEIWYGQRKRRELRRNILNLGRRGSAATRPLSTTGQSRTNRTGSKSTRSAAAPAVPISRASAAAAAPRLGNTGTNPVVVQQESAQSKAARDAMATSKSLPKATSVQKSGSSTRSSFTSRVVTQIFQRPMDLLRGFTRPVARFAAPARARAPTPLLVSPGQVPALTALEAQGVSSPPSRCDCPPKRTPTKRDRCANPIISRTVKDGIITTKREQKCPQSKPK